MAKPYKDLLADMQSNNLDLFKKIKKSKVEVSNAKLLEKAMKGVSIYDIEGDMSGDFTVEGWIDNVKVTNHGKYPLDIPDPTNEPFALEWFEGKDKKGKEKLVLVNKELVTHPGLPPYCLQTWHDPNTGNLVLKKVPLNENPPLSYDNPYLKPDDLIPSNPETGKPYFEIHPGWEELGQFPEDTIKPAVTNTKPKAMPLLPSKLKKNTPTLSTFKSQIHKPIKAPGEPVEALKTQRVTEVCMEGLPMPLEAVKPEPNTYWIHDGMKVSHHIHNATYVAKCPHCGMSWTLSYQVLQDYRDTLPKAVPGPTPGSFKALEYPGSLSMLAVIFVEEEMRGIMLFDGS